jgi:hypothetical protein
MKRFLQSLSLTAGAAAILGSGVLQAAGHRTEPLEIPFDFVVQGKHLPAGTYRLQRGTAERIDALVNVRTGAQVQVLRSVGGDGHKTKLIFERQGDTYVLRKLS